MKIRFSGWLAALLLSACGADNGPAPAAAVSDTVAADGRAATASCHSISGGHSAVTFEPDVTCVGCFAAEESAAIDNDQSTAAQFTIPASVTGAGALRATSQPGVVFPAGARATVLAGLSQLADVELIGSVAVATYLNGELQERASPSSNVVGGHYLSAGDPVYHVLVSTKPFDAVEFRVEGVRSGYIADVYEICSHSDAPAS